jgi:hypothetical protein
MASKKRKKVFFETRNYDDTWSRAGGDFFRGSKPFNDKHRDLVESDGVHNVRVREV